MNNYRLCGTGETIRGTAAVLAGLAIASNMALHTEEMSIKLRQSTPRPGEYRLSTDASSSGGVLMRFVSQSASSSQDGSIEQAVASLYERLLAKQEPLGDDFAKVLHDNRWDLYET